jgi:hypothetical protein
MKLCKLQFACDKKWEQLLPTKTPSARYCDDCHKAVFMVKTEHEFRLASALKRCVGIADDNDFIGLIGDPAAPGGMDWMEYDQSIPVSVALVGSISEARILELRLVYPRLFDDTNCEGGLLSGNSVSIGEIGPKEFNLLQQELLSMAPELRAKSGA